MSASNMFGFMNGFRIDKYLTDGNCYVRYEENQYALIHDKQNDSLRIVTRYYDNTLELCGVNISGFENHYGTYLSNSENGKTETLNLYGYVVFMSDLRPLKILCSEYWYHANNFLLAMQAMKEYIAALWKDRLAKKENSEFRSISELKHDFVYINHKGEPVYFYKKPDCMRRSRDEMLIEVQYDGISTLLEYDDAEKLNSDFAILESGFEKLRS